METLELIDRVEVLPRDCVVGIYGAGGRGSLLMHILRERRPDVRVRCFFDDYKDGDVAGVPILRYGRDRPAVQFDWLLVASVAAADILPRLRADERYCLANIAQFDGHFANDYFSDAQWAEAADAFRAVRRILTDARSRDLLDQLLAARRRRPNDLAGRFARGLWQQRQYLEHLRPEGVCHVIDAGVFDGATSLAFLQTLPDVRRIVGFEPVRHFLETSPHLAALRASGRFEWVPCALSDAPGWADMAIDARNPSAARFATEGGGGTVRVPVVTLDDHLAGCAQPVDFIKFDLEGADHAALRGASATLRRWRPQLAVSIYHSKEDLYRIPLWLREHLDNYEYRLGHYSPDIYETVLYALPR